jgi:crotonobetainyl-CoA:carnitine CoA-transferase CaiB-like acyl-CoA transferase
MPNFTAMHPTKCRIVSRASTPTCHDWRSIPLARRSSRWMICAAASPMRFSETPVEYELPPPLLGQHTREVLGELLGMRREELDQLAAKKII